MRASGRRSKANKSFKKTMRKMKKGVDIHFPLCYNIFCSERTQAPIAQLDRAFDYESKGHRFESCWVHHEPLTSFAPLAVFLLSFCREFFLILLDFLSLTSRSAASVSEDVPRLFSLWSRSIPVVLIKMGDLAQIMAQNLSGGCRFSLAPPVFFSHIALAQAWHKPPHPALNTFPIIAPACMTFSSLACA